MKLTTLEIQRFGKFQNKVISLPDGLMLWVDENESGKSTTADFIRFIFFGLEKLRGKRTLGENLLEKYQPWDSSDGLAGALEFADEAGRKYRIERTQDAKGRTQVRVLDHEGNELDIAQPGEHFLGLDAETFVNIFYIQQGENAPHRTAGMDVAMKNLMTTGSEEISFDSVMKFLQAEKAKYSSPKRQMGKLKNLQERLGELERSVAYKMAEISEQKRLMDDPKDVEAEIKRLNLKIQELQGEKKNWQGYQAYLRQKEREKLKEEQANLVRQLANDCPSDEETGLLYDILQQLERLAVLREQAEKDYLELKGKEVVLGKREQIVLEHHQALNDSVGKVLAILGGILLVAGLGGTLLSKWCVFGAIAGVVLLTVGIIKLRLPAPLRAQGIRSKAQLMQALTSAAAAKQAADSYQEAFAKALQNKENAALQEKETKAKYLPLLERTGVFSLRQLEAVQNKQLSHRMQSARLDEITKILEQLSLTQEQDEQIACNKMPATEQEHLETLLQQAEADKEALLRKLAEGAALAAQVSAKEEKLVSEQEDMAQTRAEYERCAFLNEVAEIAAGAMEKAQQKLRENYAPALREKVEQKLCELTDGKYDCVTLGEDFSLRIKAEGGLRALDYFSQGTRDAAFLALRLALAEVVQPECAVPMIFDDPFLNFDAKRREKLKIYLQKAGRERQIILFSCREF